MAKSWQEISTSEMFLSETPDVQQEIAKDYFTKVIVPKVKQNGDDLQEVYSDFMTKWTNGVQSSTEVAASIDDQLARANTAVRDAGERGNLNSTEKKLTDSIPSYMQKPKDPVYTGAGTPEEQQQYIIEEAKPFMDEAKTLVGTDDFRGLTQGQIAEKLALANRQKYVAEGVATAVTLPLSASTAPARLALQTALGAGTVAAGQAAESLSLGKNRFDVADLGLGAAAGLAGGVIGEGLGYGISKVTPYMKRKLGNDAAAEGLRDAETLRKTAELGDRKIVDAVYQNGDVPAQAVAREAITDAEGNIILTPGQALTGNTVDGRYIRSSERRAMGKGTADDVSDAIEIQDDGSSLVRAVEGADSLTTTGRGATGGNYLQETLADSQSAIKRSVTEAYTSTKKEAQNILDSKKIKSMKLPGMKNTINTHLSYDNKMGGNVLSAGSKKLLKSLNKANIKNIDELDSWKRTLSEQSSKDYRAGDYASNKAVREVLDGLRNEADDFIAKIDPNAGSIYREADSLYSEITPGYGKKSVLNKIVNNENPDTASNKLLSPRSQNARFNTEQVGKALTGTVKRAEREAAKAQNALDNLMPEEFATKGTKLQEDLARANSDLEYARRATDDFAQAVGSEARAKAIEAGNNISGERFGTKQFANTLDRTAPSVAEADAVATTAVNQRKINKSLRDIADAFSRNRKLSKEELDLMPKGTVMALIVDYMYTGGMAAAGVIAKRFLYDTGLVDKWFSTGARARKYRDFLVDPANSVKLIDVMENGPKAISKYTSQEAKDYVDGILEFAKVANRNTANSVRAAMGSNVQVPQQRYQQEAPAQEFIYEDTSTEELSQDNTPKSTTDALYAGFVNAETGGLKDPWIRTMARDKSGAGESSAYGPAQMTGTLVQDMVKRYPQKFSTEELEYAKDFIAQSKIMLKNPNDPRFGYGKKGLLGEDENLRKQYESVAKKIIDILLEENGGDYNKLKQRWRGVNDPKYFAKVDDAVSAYLDNNNKDQQVG